MAVKIKISTLIINMIIFAYSLAQGQISGVFSINKFDKRIECNIYFYNSGWYYMELNESVTSDIDESLVLSYGKYLVNNNEVTLIDKIHNFTILLTLQNEILTVKKAFCFLINNSFVFHNGITNSEPKFLHSNIDTLMLQEKRKNAKKSHKTLPSLEFGVFENDLGYRLLIQEKNRYKLEYKNVLISAGEWRKDRNELELKDLDLKHSFYVYLDYKYLISCLLPGDYKGISLLKNY